MIDTTVSHYRIIEKLGGGGMGVVYKAEDTRLRRCVALKFLPDDVSSDPQALGRFRREAQAASALNHPNICTIYDVGEENGRAFIAMELLEGATLRSKMQDRTFKTEQVLDLAVGITQALDAAHSKGIVHRDLKPENVFVTKDGRAKVLDFGLAKLMPPDAASSSDGATFTMESSPGMLLGTVGYMSPEQVRGRAFDARTDIFSFGVMLVEVLTGRNPFLRATSADTMSAILNDAPPEPEQSPSIGPAVYRIVCRCLEKDPAARFQSVRDLGFALLALKGNSGMIAALAPVGDEKQAKSKVPVSRRLGPAILGLLIGGSAMWLLLHPLHQNRKLMITNVARLTHEPGLTQWPAWSPDGTLLVFASNRTGNFEIYVRRVDGGQEVNITNNPGQDVQPSFSPDGASIAYVSTRSSKTGLIKIGPYIGFEYRTYGGDVWVAPALGGPPRRVAEDGNFPVWSPDGKKLAYVGGVEDHRSIMEVPVEGGAATTLLSTKDSQWEIIRLQYSPKGKWLVFEQWDQRMFLMPASGGTVREIFRGSSPAWDAAGDRLYFAKQEQLGGTSIQAVEFDEEAGKFKGEPHNLGVMTGILRDLAMNRHSKQLVVTEIDESLNLTRVALAPGGAAVAGTEETLNPGRAVRDRYPTFSPDEKVIAFGDNRFGDQELWLLDLATRHRERLRLPRTDIGANLPFWSPDGRHLGVTRFLPDGTASLWVAAVDGSGAEELVPPKPILRGGPFSPDGRMILYAYKKNGFSQVFAFDLNSRQERQLTSSQSDKYDPIWTPDGKSIVFSSNRSGSGQIWKSAVAGGEEEQLTEGADRLRHLTFSPDERWIYVQPNHLNVYRIPASGGKLEPVTNFPEGGLFIEDPKVSPDGRWLVYCRSNGGSSLWLLGLGTTN